jgi:hypothetical protein
MINSRKVSELDPYVNKLYKKEGITIQVTSTLRDAEYQKYLFGMFLKVQIHHL